jgi:hypothetical protein
MFVCIYYVFVLFSVGSGLATADPPSKESYRLCIGLKTEKVAKIHKDCRGRDRYIGR